MKREPDAAPLVAHLKATVPVLKGVSLVAADTGRDGAPMSSPSAQVFYAGARYETRHTSHDRKKGEARFVVLLAAKQAGAKGTNGLSELSPVRDAVIEALDGWRHPACRDALELTLSRFVIVDPKSHTLWWELGFKADFYLEKDT